MTRRKKWQFVFYWADEHGQITHTWKMKTKTITRDRLKKLIEEEIKLYKPTCWEVTTPGFK